jgi:fumarate reductase subunit C
MTTATKSKELIRTMSPTWWLKNPAYTRFMIRDFTSVFIAGYCVFLIVLLYRANQDVASFQAFYGSLRSPLSIVLHLIALLFAVYHSVTFFNLTPRVMVVYRGDERVPDATIATTHYVLWFVATVVLFALAILV